MSIIQKNPMEKDKSKDIPQKNKELEDDKPDYQEKITFLVSTVAQAFILTWCLLVLSLGYVKLPNKLFGIDIPDQPRVDSTFAAGLLGNMKTPLRAAAPFRYISTVLPSKNVLDYRYEHIIPARVVGFYMSEYYLKNNQDIDLNTLLNDYSVAVIPKTMDNVVGKFFGQTMNLDYQIGMHPTKRYYNMFTQGEVGFAVKDLRDNKIYGEGYVEIYNKVQQIKKN